jgi:uncharacterized protein (DUF1015 family)
MAEVIPLRALRYNPAVVEDLSHVVAPPYDVISPAAQERYYARHPYNVIRLILARESDPEAPGESRYQRSARAFAAWRAEGVLRRDAAPALYPYEQEFSTGARRLRRRGFLALVRLQDYGAKIIFPHERTFSRHKEDRLQLMRACRANLEAILGFYPGPRADMEAILERRMATDPAVRLEDEEGVGHRLWVLDDPADVTALGAALVDRPIFIADGHHRYETALRFRDQEQAAETAPPELARRRLHHYVLIHLVHAEDPGLVILPTHRLIRQRPALAGDALRAALARHFAVEPFPVRSDDPGGSVRQVLQRFARQAGISCALYAGGPEFLILTLTDAGVQDEFLQEGRSAAYAGLDVAVLHRQVIERLLGLSPEAQADDAIRYTRDEAEAVGAVRAGEAHLALFLNPPRAAQVEAVALAGERMPQKSTYFYPKVLSGLVISPLDPDDLAPV